MGVYLANDIDDPNAGLFKLELSFFDGQNEIKQHKMDDGRIIHVMQL